MAYKGDYNMKIGDLLAMTKKESLEEIAKQHLTIGKTTARQALKNAGCYCKRGIRGWYHDNLNEVAEYSIYDFAPLRKRQPKLNGTESAIKQLIAKADMELSTQLKKEASQKTHLSDEVNPKETAGDVNGYEQFDAVDRILFREELMRDLKTYKGFYWDEDIMNFIDSVNHERQSELMNEIVRSVLTNKGFL